MSFQINETQLVSINPATEEPMGYVTITPTEQMPHILTQAQKAGKSWARTSLSERIAVLTRALEQAETHTHELGHLISQEMGKPLSAGIGEARYALQHARQSILHDARQALVSERLHESGRVSDVHYVARGVVGVITPWNFPVSLSLNALIPALVAGNSVIYKPSEHTSLTGQRLVELLNAHLPHHVLQGVYGTGEQGAAIASTAVDMVAFIGSQATGQKIMAAQSTYLNPLILEMGGKDAMIVLDDADLEQAARYAVMGSLRNSGQVCVSVERIFVLASIAESFIAQVRQQMLQFKMGDPADEKTQMGPMVSDTQRQNVLAQLKDAVVKGATLEGGTLPEGRGYYLRPALVTHVNDDMLLMQDETFGPVIAIQTVETVEQAIAKANQLSYGLGASLWSQSPQASALALQLEAGMVGVNQGSGGVSGTPFVGNKKSSLGYFGGAEGARQFAQIRVLTRVLDA